MEQPILSIYTATYNRKEILLRSVKKLLSLQTDAFDIFILDDQSSDGTVEVLQDLQDTRLHVYRNEQRAGNQGDGAMPNWFKLAEMCDGVYCFHLNDRDHLETEGLERLLDFLQSHPDLAGGVCDLQSGYKICTGEDFFLQVPYNALHPTGIVFSTAYFHQIPDRASFYTKKKSYIHPHDLVLGKLCEMGSLFRFEKIWSLADQKSFRENKSFLYKKGSASTAWFAPAERMKEYELFLAAIQQQKFDDQKKAQKIFQMSKHYLFYCTFNYAYFISDSGQTAHYGIEPRKLSFFDMNREKSRYITKTLDLYKKTA